MIVPIVHFLPRGSKRNQNKTPLSCGPFGASLRVAATAGAHGNSLCSDRPCAFARPSRRCSARNKGVQLKTFQHPLARLSGGYL